MSDNLPLLYDKIETHPSKYASWTATEQVRDCGRDLDRERLISGLSSKDPYTRECYTEILTARGDPEIVSELEGIFQNANVNLTGNVESLNRLRARSSLSPDFYKQLQVHIADHPNLELRDSMVLIDAIPNIYFPAKNVKDQRNEEHEVYVSGLLATLRSDDDYFKTISGESMGKLHALFYEDYDNPRRSTFRTQRLWGYERDDEPTDPYGLPLISPSVIPHVMGSLETKLSDYEQVSLQRTNPIQFIGESFHHVNTIHPYDDCNGRANFLFLNLFLQKHGLPYVKMEFDELPDYYKSLNSQTPSRFIEFIGSLIKKSAKK